MFELRHIPNTLTVFRLMLVPVVAWSILSEQYALAVALFFVAGFSDGVDGFLARRFSWQSKLGAILDPIADKLLMITCFYCLFSMGFLPWWLFLAVLLRDVLIIGGAFLYQHFTHALQMEPILLGKLNTLVQIGAVMGLLLYAAFGWFEGPLITLALVGLTLSTVVSGTAYITIWIRKIRRA